MGQHDRHDSLQLPSGTQGEGFEATDTDRAQGDGYNLLARVRGPAFLVEASSLNPRSFTPDLWTPASGSRVGTRVRCGRQRADCRSWVLGSNGAENRLKDLGRLVTS